MPTLAYPLAGVIERLQGTDPIELIGLGADLNAALSTPPRVARAVYVLASTKGGPLKYTGNPIQQDRSTTVVLVIWVRNHGKPEATRADMDSVLAAIDARLAGWTPGNAFSSLVFDVSRDEFAHAQYLVVQAHYTSSWNFSAQRQP